MTAPVNLDTSSFGSRKPNPLQRIVIALARATPLRRGAFRRTTRGNTFLLRQDVS